MRRILIYDTTLRDGAQAEEVDFSLQDKLSLAARLDEMGVDYIEGGYPASNEKDAEFFKRMAKTELEHAKICAFGMTRRKGIAAADDEGLRALLDSEAPVITIVGKSSAFQAREVIQTDLETNLEMIADSIAHLVAQGREVIYDAEHFFDGWKDDADYAMKTLETAVKAGAMMLVLCDTNGGTMSDEIGQITRKVTESFDVPIGIHCHNDCDLAVANSLAAVDGGASCVQGTINGFGERCGNADLITTIANLAVKKEGFELLLPDSIGRLTELSRFVYEMVNMNFRTHQPFVGKSAFAHKGGMHVSGIARNTSSYEHIAPEQVGNERRILVSELSGRSNIKAITTKLGIDVDPKLMSEILARVVEMENRGYQFEAADGSFDLLVRRCAGTYRPHFELIKFHATTEADSAGQVTTQATVKLRIGEGEDSIRLEVAEGDGPVNALDAAMRKALYDHFPELQTLHLVDYKVRVINSEAATAARVRVVIESQDETDSWGTVGVSENIIEASWFALVDSFEYMLCRAEEAAKQ